MARTIVFVLMALVVQNVATVAAAAEFTVRAVAIPEMKAVFGQVQSRTVVPARARIGGTIRDIGVSEGDEVKEGQVIGTVVDEKIALELAAAEAKIREVRSQLDNARTELERAEQLLSRGVAPQGRVDLAQTQFEVATNQLVAAESARAVIEQQVLEGAVLAPATGRVLRVPVTAGSVVLPGEEIARIASGQYYLRLSLPERHAAEITSGSKVLLGVRGLAGGSDPQAEQVGEVVKVYPEIAEGRVIADVMVDGLGDYFVNERALVWVAVGSRSALTVPVEAVKTRHGIDYVMLSTDGGMMEVSVILGETVVFDDGPQIEVLTGLREGDRVLVP